MTGSAASTLVVSRRWEFLFERPLWRDRVQLRNVIEKKGEGSGEGVGLGLVADRALGGLREGRGAVLAQCPPRELRARALAMNERECEGEGAPGVVHCQGQGG